MAEATDVISLEALARRIEAPAASVRRAGLTLFEQLSSPRPDLSQALARAASAGNLNPVKVHGILAAMAEDLRKSLPLAAERATRAAREKAAP